VVREEIVADANRFGRKHTCYGCGVKFYDMNRPGPVCPRCGADQDRQALSEAPVVITDDDLDEVVGRVFDDDRSLPGDLDIEVRGLDGDESNIPSAADELGGDEE